MTDGQEFSAVESCPRVLGASECEFKEVTEGRARIRFPADNRVFYNPVQEFNRDLSVVVIRTWLHRQGIQSGGHSTPESPEHCDSSSPRPMQTDSKCQIMENTDPSPQIMKTVGGGINAMRKIKLLDALSASGLRSVRYALELPAACLETIVANDMSPAAVKMIGINRDYNQISPDVLVPNLDDASALMYRHRSVASQFDVIDLDPYGTASPFLDAAVQSIRSGGLLCVTCTDLAVLAGKYPETCYAKYGGTPIRGDACHEMALRLLLHAIQSSASRYKRHIVPLLSCSVDFYIRVFVLIVESPIAVKSTFAKTSLFYQCSGCTALYSSPLGVVHCDSGTGQPSRYSLAQSPKIGSICPDCEHVYHISGPAWSGPLHDADFVAEVLNHLKTLDSPNQYGTHNRMLGMISLIAEELPAMLYYTYSGLCKVLHCAPIPMLKMNSALLNAGYRVSQTHCNSNAFKTNAPISAIWDIFRHWVESNPVKLSKYPAESASVKILSKPQSDIVISFDLHSEANPGSRKQGLTRFEFHKGMDWGPKARAKRRYC